MHSSRGEAVEALFPGSCLAHRRFPVEITELATGGQLPDWAPRRCAGGRSSTPRRPPSALRVDLGGVSFAYSGDTQWTPVLAEAGRGTDRRRGRYRG